MKALHITILPASALYVSCTCTSYHVIHRDQLPEFDGKEVNAFNQHVQCVKDELEWHKEYPANSDLFTSTRTLMEMTDQQLTGTI